MFDAIVHEFKKDLTDIMCRLERIEKMLLDLLDEKTDG